MCRETIAVSPKMQMELLEEVAEEIYRNGFKKIVLLNPMEEISIF